MQFILDLPARVQQVEERLGCLQAQARQVWVRTSDGLHRLFLTEPQPFAPAGTLALPEHVARPPQIRRRLSRRLEPLGHHVILEELPQAA